MYKIILILVVLFSISATAENIKYKRNHIDNMNMHFKCLFLAEKAGLNDSRIDVHIKYGFDYGALVWDKLSNEVKGSHKDVYDYFDSISDYQRGFVSRFVSSGRYGKSVLNEVYLNTCQEDELLFSSKGK